MVPSLIAKNQNNTNALGDEPHAQVLAPGHVVALLISSRYDGASDRPLDRGQLAEKVMHTPVTRSELP
jgi:hypothetical protein